MKKLLILTLGFLLIFSDAVIAQKLVIMHTNDMHSRITGYGPELFYTPEIVNNDKTLGGFARLAAIIDEQKAQNPNSLLVLDDGDFMMGTIFHALEPETGFEINLMKQIGYDAVTLGNHEFDFGPEALADMISSAQKRGGAPQFVASFLQFSEQSGDDKLQKLYDNGAIKPYTIIEKNGLKIGIFSVLGKDAQNDIKFAKPLQFADPVKTAKYYTKLLRDKEKVDIVICLSHSGVVPSEKGGFEGEDIDLAKKVKDIDIIISGHTHVVTPHYLQVGKTIIVQTGAYLHDVGRLEINYDNGKVSVTDFKLIPLDDKIKGDEKINKEVDAFKARINKEILSQFGLSYNQKIAEAHFDMKLSSHEYPHASTMGNLISDAVKYYVDTYSSGTDVVLTANGVIREGIYEGPQTAPDAFRIMSLGFGKDDYLGYPLVKIYITGLELKKLMELSIMSNEPGSDKYLYYSGIKVYYDPKGGFLNKVRKMEVNGQEVDFSKKSTKLYSLTTDIYIMNFIGEIKKMSYGLIKIVPKDSKGEAITDFNKYILDFDKNKPGIQEGKQWLGLIKYMQTFKDTDGNGIPDIPEKYKTFYNLFIPLQK